jgi:predicted small secreted protein
MKTQIRILLLLLALGGQFFVATGCVNTAKGVQKDYQKAEDKVERAVK